MDVSYLMIKSESRVHLLNCYLLWRIMLRLWGLKNTFIAVFFRKFCANVQIVKKY